MFYLPNTDLRILAAPNSKNGIAIKPTVAGSGTDESVSEKFPVRWTHGATSVS